MKNGNVGKMDYTEMQSQITNLKFKSQLPFYQASDCFHIGWTFCLFAGRLAATFICRISQSIAKLGLVTHPVAFRMELIKYKV